MKKCDFCVFSIGQNQPSRTSRQKYERALPAGCVLVTLGWFIMASTNSLALFIFCLKCRNFQFGGLHTPLIGVILKSIFLTWSANWSNFSILFFEFLTSFPIDIGSLISSPTLFKKTWRMLHSLSTICPRKIKTQDAFENNSLALARCIRSREGKSDIYPIVEARRATNTIFGRSP